MNASAMRRIAIVGAGVMGQGIAQDFATHGYDVSMYAPAGEETPATEQPYLTFLPDFVPTSSV